MKKSDVETSIKRTKQWLNMESDNALALISRHGMDLLSVHDSYGRYLFVSDNCEEFYGWSNEELIGKAAYDFFHPDDFEAIGKSHERSLYNADENVVVYRILCKDKSFKWVETTSRTVRRDDTDRGTIVTITRDVRHRKPERAATY